MRPRRRSPGHGDELLHVGHGVLCEKDGALVLVIERAAVVDRVEHVHVRGVDGRAVGEAEDGDELVSEDLDVRERERGRRGAVCDCKFERLRLLVGLGGCAAEKQRHGTEDIRWTRQTSPCICANAKRDMSSCDVSARDVVVSKGWYASVAIVSFGCEQRQSRTKGDKEGGAAEGAGRRGVWAVVAEDFYTKCALTTRAQCEFLLRGPGENCLLRS